MLQYTLHTLTSGLRCVHTGASGLAEVCGVTIDAGSRDEAPGEEGLAHFVEHMIFKGTTRRRAWHILNAMESVGGELNAYTTKESTTVYSVSPRGNSRRALDMIADLICNSVFPARELEKEREVVADEIDSYLDMPSETVWDDIDELAFAGSSLAHNILGTRDALAGFNSEMCRRWIERHYTPLRMVLFYSGHLSHQRFFAMAERIFASLNGRNGQSTARIAPAMPVSQIVTRRIDSHQAHTIMASRLQDGLSMYSPSRHAIQLLTNIIGGPGMNSLLNVALRERRGLVYSVEASTTFYTDSALLAVYFGCDPSDTSRCVRLVRDTLDRLAQSPMSERRLSQCRRQYLGQLALASENRENSALAIGRATLYRGRPSTLDEVRSEIENVSAEALMESARLLAKENTICLTLE